jgi:trans-aconitate methyltransferase
MKENYCWRPEEYKNNSAMQSSMAQEVIACLGLRGKEKVLDIGCGDGKITAQIARLIPAGYVVGVDSSPEMIEFSRKNFFSQNNLRFDLCDARDLKFSNEFDVVFSSSCLHWIKDHRPILAGIKKSLTP